MRVAVTDHEGREVAAARNLDILRKASAPSSVPTASPAWTSARERWEKSGLSSWDFGPLPETVAAGPFTAAFPGFEPAEGGVNIRLFTSGEEAAASHVKGVEALLLPRFAKDVEFVKRYLALPEEYEAPARFFGGRAALAKAMIESLKREVFRKNIRSAEALETLAAGVVRALFEKGQELREAVIQVLDACTRVRRVLPKAPGTALKEFSSLRSPAAEAGETLRGELDRLVPADFPSAYPASRLRHLPRYLDALRIRAERAKFDPEKDRRKAEQVEPFTDALARLRKGFDADTSPEKKAAVEEFRWMIEEFRVALFAPEVKTAHPVSPKRLAARIREIEEMV